MQFVLPRPYQKNSPINRTILLHLPFGMTDFQGLPPYSWCERCGAEVYRPGHRLCARCHRQRPHRFPGLSVVH